MEVILVRHGKAVDRGVIPEFDRYLTEEGIEDLRKGLPVLAPYMEGKSYEIWSSPLVRAMQTAEILSESLGGGSVVEKRFLAGGHLVEAVDDLECANVDSVFMVGHEPFLSEWIYRLTGEHLDVKKGAVCVIDLDTLLRDGSVTWYKTLKTLKEEHKKY